MGNIYDDGYVAPVNKNDLDRIVMKQLVSVEKDHILQNAIKVFSKDFKIDPELLTAYILLSSRHEGSSFSNRYKLSEMQVRMYYHQKQQQSFWTKIKRFFTFSKSKKKQVKQEEKFLEQANTLSRLERESARIKERNGNG